MIIVVFHRIFIMLLNAGFATCFFLRSNSLSHSLIKTLNHRPKHYSLRNMMMKPTATMVTATHNRNSENIVISQRLQNTERPYIEDVLDKYIDLPNITKLALGSSHWGPPVHALEAIQHELFETSTHKYSSILGLDELRLKIRDTLLLTSKGSFPSLSDEIIITAGANQAMINIAMTLCDPRDDVIIISPYYFSHLLSFQLVNANVHICPFDPATLSPNWEVLDDMLRRYKPKAIIVTNPNNPSGKVWNRDEIQNITSRCSENNAHLVLDQTYYEFLYNNNNHIFPSKDDLGYEKIISVFSMSKVFGMPGWRVGYIVCPSSLIESMRKIQDTVPTHASVLSQKLALQCLTTYDHSTGSNPWFTSHLTSLDNVRNILWPILEPLRTVRTEGAFYFLVPLPDKIDEDEAVDILARQFGVLLMHGSPFGAKGHLRLSYGSIPPQEVVSAVDKLQKGFDYLQKLSSTREKTNEHCWRSK